MNEKEQRFCRFYAQTGNPREAAARAGYHMRPERWGLKLLEQPDVRRAIKALCAQHAPDGQEGLRRVAFGSAADAVRLLWMDAPPAPEELEAMDLFMVAEIKRPKGGGMEIKFFDRLKALEQLLAAGEADRQDALPFYQALTEGARRLKGADLT